MSGHVVVPVEAWDSVRHLLEVYIDNGMVEHEDVLHVDRLWAALDDAVPVERSQDRYMVMRAGATYVLREWREVTR